MKKDNIKVSSSSINGWFYCLTCCSFKTIILTFFSSVKVKKWRKYSYAKSLYIIYHLFTYIFHYLSLYITKFIILEVFEIYCSIGRRSTSHGILKSLRQVKKNLRQNKKNSHQIKNNQWQIKKFRGNIRKTNGKLNKLMAKENEVLTLPYKVSQ